MTIAVISMIRDPWGGSEELWYQMAKASLQKGHKVVHLGYENPVTHPKMKELEQLGLIREVRPGWLPTHGSKRLIRLGYNFLRKKIKDAISNILKYKPDVVLYNGTCYSIGQEKSLLKILRSDKARSFKFFIIGHLNHDLIRTINNQEANSIMEAYQLCEKVFFVSNRNRETAERQLCAMVSNYEIIRNPVNLASVDLLPFPSKEDIINLASVGNLVTAHKGQDILLHALRKWKEKNWILNIYGSGLDKEYLENLTSFFGLQGKVVFHGSISNIRDVWAQNHILLMPSHMEGMPLAVVEAMLCGRVCIATDVGGNSEWITDSYNGFICEAATVNSLLKALDRAWSMKSRWEEIGVAAHETAMGKYDPYAGETLLNRIINK